MTANKMPEMPEAAATVTVDAVVVFDLGGPRHVWCQTIELAAQNEMAPGAKVYTADQMRAMYLAGIADARACVPEAREDESHGKYDWGRTDGFNACRNLTLANLTALEQEAKK